MLELAADRAAGAHTTHATPEHTREARAILGPGKLLAVEVTVVLATDRAEARRIARDHLAFYLVRKFYRAMWSGLGFAEEDLEAGGSDRLVDAVIAWGSVDDVQRRVAEHFEAGADHVCVQPLGDDPADVRVDDLRELAPALTELS
jgi:probable F420-dependent oxidoreductase